MEGAWDGRLLYDLYREASTPWEWQAPAEGGRRRAGHRVLLLPFDAEAIEFLEGLGVPAYKIASFELVDTQLIERATATGKPVIMSTGMATREEIADAIAAARGVKPDVELALLKCTSELPGAARSISTCARSRTWPRVRGPDRALRSHRRHRRAR